MHKKRFRQAVAIECIAREQHDIGPRLRCSQKDGTQTTCAIAVEKPRSIVVIDMHVGCMRDQNLAAFGSVCLHLHSTLLFSPRRHELAVLGRIGDVFFKKNPHIIRKDEILADSFLHLRVGRPFRNKAESLHRILAVGLV